MVGLLPPEKVRQGGEKAPQTLEGGIVSRVVEIRGDGSVLRFPTICKAADYLGMPRRALARRMDGNVYDKGRQTMKTYRKESERNAKAVKVVCVGDGYSIIYDSIKDTADELGCSEETIRRRLKDGMCVSSAEFGNVRVRYA